MDPWFSSSNILILPVDREIHYMSKDDTPKQFNKSTTEIWRRDTSAVNGTMDSLQHVSQLLIWFALSSLFNPKLCVSFKDRIPFAALILGGVYTLWTPARIKKNIIVEGNRWLNKMSKWESKERGPVLGLCFLPRQAELQVQALSPLLQKWQMLL